MIRRVFSFLIGAFLCSAVSFGAGRQLTGVYAPAATPALAPEEAAKKMTLPDGFEARIFAYEPQVVNPVAMTWDDRGRLWVVELYEYPLGAAPGTKPRDNVKILEDTDNDGRADKVTVFADGLNLATGILIGHGGVYVGQAPGASRWVGLRQISMKLSSINRARSGSTANPIPISRSGLERTFV